MSSSDAAKPKSGFNPVVVAVTPAPNSTSSANTVANPDPPFADNSSRHVGPHRLHQLHSLLEVGRALTAEHDLEALLSLVVDEAAKMVDADRCSLFLVDRDRGEVWSKIAHGVGVGQEIRLPIGIGISGFAALSGQVVNIPDAYADPRFNRETDARTGYTTRSMLCVPMRRADGEVVGLLLALNKKGTDGQAGPFDTDDELMLEALGGQAAVAINNAVLHEEIGQLFEGFIRASVVAIESRDPSTSGHSERVATLSVGLAESLERESVGPYARTSFTREELKELRYAALLHDFGKVGVRENVLVKAEKLYPSELETVRTRFALIRRTLELEAERQKVLLLKSRPKELELEVELARIDKEIGLRLTELYDFEAFVTACNRPQLLAGGTYARLVEISQRSFLDGNNIPRPYLEPGEVESLRIERGSLSSEERREIESHVSHTYRFLAQIPWTKALKRVPEIAYAHHEKLNGTGYPRGLKAPAIPLQARMMTVADIYDALTAKDRPYKKAVPHGVALDILHHEANKGQLDAELLRIFIASDVPSRLKPR
jgi:HD-GYP domain-containing protein (c-di-GMP phosphodiesterase class II)